MQQGRRGLSSRRWTLKRRSPFAPGAEFNVWYSAMTGMTTEPKPDVIPNLRHRHRPLACLYAAQSNAAGRGSRLDALRACSVGHGMVWRTCKQQCGLLK